MNELRHLQKAMDDATNFLITTWSSVVFGAAKIPRVPDLKINVQLRKAYADSIREIDRVNLPSSGRFQRRVVATHKAATDLEHGSPAWDMKPGLLKGPKSRVNKKGQRYNVIPFRHGTSAKYSPNSLFRPMPMDIHQAAKKLKDGERLTGTTARRPALVHRFVKENGEVTDYQHKSGRYENMVKNVEEGQEKYTTFRVVSENSDPNSWWHPGFEAHDIAQGVSDFCKPIIEDSIKHAAEMDLVDIPDLSVAFDVRLK